jgi:hypothetical protein
VKPLRVFLPVLMLIAMLSIWTTPVPVQESVPLPLAEEGPYAADFELPTFTDTARDNRSL